jgi:hypothetical protein
MEVFNVKTCFSEKPEQQIHHDSLQANYHANTTKKNFVGVDIFKFFFAICIVALHTGALGVLSYIPNYFITKIIPK